MLKDSNQNPFTDTRRVENFLEKPLPSNVEAEQALLGMVLLDNDVMPQLAEVVLPEDMYSPMHRNVYAAMLELFAGKRPIDPILIGDELARQGILEQIGGVPAITNLSYGLPHITDLTEHIKVVLDHSTARELIRACNRITAATFDGAEPLDEIKSDAERTIFEICEGRNRATKPQAVGELAFHSLEHKRQLAEQGVQLVGIPSGLIDLDNMTGGWRSPDLMILAGRPGMGKAQPLDAGVLTMTGYRPMGELAIGDPLASVDGQESYVTGIFPQGERQVYRMTLSDGRSTECCAEHLWRVNCRHWSEPKVLDTATLIKKLGKKRYQNRIWIEPFTGQFGTDDEVTVNPWLLGVLLGDGTITDKSVRFSTVSTKLLEQVTAIVESEFALIVNHVGKCDYRIVQRNRGQRLGKSGRSDNPLKIALNNLGLKGCNSATKFIPPVYFAASFETRMWLLAGLIDTDGWVEKFGVMRYATSSHQLAADVVTLVRSLGGTASVRDKAPIYTYAGEQRSGQASYVVNIQFPQPLPGMQLLPEKQERVIPRLCQRRLNIQSIVPTRVTQTQCISVSHPSQLYVTDDYIVTHNTALGMQFAMRAATDGRVVAFFSLEMSKDQLVSRVLCTEARVNLFRYNNAYIHNQEWDRLREAYEFEIRHKGLFIDDEPAISPMKMLAKARRIAAEQKRLDLIVVDYLQLMSASSKSESRLQEVSAISRELKAIAKQMDVPVLALSQLSRAPEARNPPKPIMSDLRESGSIEQDADMVMFVYREAYYKKLDDGSNSHIAEIILAKQRNGPTGDVQCHWNAPSTRFENLQQERRD